MELEKELRSLMKRDLFYEGYSESLKTIYQNISNNRTPDSISKASLLNLLKRMQNDIQVQKIKDQGVKEFLLKRLETPQPDLSPPDLSSFENLSHENERTPHKSRTSKPTSISSFYNLNEEDLDDDEDYEDEEDYEDSE